MFVEDLSLKNSFGVKSSVRNILSDSDLNSGEIPHVYHVGELELA